MSADEALLRTDERALDVDADHRRSHLGVAAMEFGKPCNPDNHPIEPIGDHRGQKLPAAIIPHCPAGLSQRSSRENVGIEVDALVAVELEVEGNHRELLWQALPSSGMPGQPHHQRVKDRCEKDTEDGHTEHPGKDRGA